MRTQEIEKLLNKYLDAETTLQEESILREYFINNEVEPHLEPYKSMFVYFNVTETYDKPILLPKPKRNYEWMKIAASIIVMVGMFIGNEVKERNDVRMAYQETTSAFNLLANNLNKGATSIGYLNEFDKATNKIFRK